MVWVKLGRAPAARWSVDPAEFDSRHGTLGFVGGRAYATLLKRIEADAFRHGYFADVIDEHLNYRDDECRLIDVPPAPPLLVFCDKQLGGRALWGLSARDEPVALVIDLMQPNPG